MTAACRLAGGNLGPIRLAAVRTRRRRSPSKVPSNGPTLSETSLPATSRSCRPGHDEAQPRRTERRRGSCGKPLVCQLLPLLDRRWLVGPKTGRWRGWIPACPFRWWPCALLL